MNKIISFLLAAVLLAACEGMEMFQEKWVENMSLQQHILILKV
ncbi:MAG: lipoprotein [Aureispira sp.]|nr:lipoprotein [Aureispira sp.]